MQNYERALSAAQTHAVDLILHTGDLYNEPAPRPEAQAAACAPLARLAEAGTPIVIIPGNHERCAIPSSLFLAHRKIHIVRQPTTLRLDIRGVRVVIAAFPCIRRDADRRFGEALQASGWSAERGDVNILAVHQAFDGARCGPGDYRFRAGNEAASLERIPSGFDYIACGHVHRQQVLSAAGVPLVYAGSTDRISFAEKDEPKGCVLVEIEESGARHQFVEHAVRPMLVCGLDVTGQAGSAVVERALQILNAAPPEALLALRLSGQATPTAMRGLRLAEQLRHARPDVSSSVAWGSVEWVTQRDVRAAAAPSAFSVLDAPAAACARAMPEDLRRLPAGVGVYALYDASGRILYVGKSKSLRTRVQSHLRGDSADGHFADWCAQVAMIEARSAESELEALLIEADLLRRLRPPFNRQLRMWQRYCFLVDADGPFSQLTVSADEVAGRTRLGPIRSRMSAERMIEALAGAFRVAACPSDSKPRAPFNSAANLCARYSLGLCSGPCAARIAPADYAAQIAARQRFLDSSGELGDRCVLHADRQPPPERHVGALEASPTADAREPLIECVRALHKAAELLGALLILPRSGSARMLAVVAEDGLHLRRMALETADAEAALAWWRSLPFAHRASGGVMPKSAADLLATAARALRRAPTQYAAIRRSQAEGCSAQTLLRIAGLGR